MIEPTGPHPQSVYWRRRAIALGSSILLVVLLAVAVSVWLGGGSQANPRGVADQKAAAGATSMTSSPPTSGTIVPASGSSSASPSPAPPSSTSATPTTTTPPPPPPPPPPPGPCPDAAMGVTARIAQPQYKVGQAPLLTLVIANTGQVACHRDVSRQLRELIVMTGDAKTKLWSSADCYYQPPAESRLLQPGEQATYSIAWAGLTSAPQCAPSGARVPAGDYVVVGKLGNVTGQPTPFKLI